MKVSAETRAKISAANKGKKATDKALAALRAANMPGVKRSAAHKKSLSEASKRRVRVPLTDETKRKIAAAHIGMKPTPETLLKMSRSKIGKAIGRDSPTYDHKVRRFSHPGLGVFTGTRADFIATHGLAAGCVSAMISGGRKTVKGWKIEP